MPRRLFQSAPGLEAGRSLPTRMGWPNSSQFQSAPGLEAGRSMGDAYDFLLAADVSIRARP